LNTASGTAVSRLGLGNYLGHLDDDTDSRLLAVTRELLALGVNHFDTAPNYRAQRSETVLGRALQDSQRARSELFIATKVGFLPFDSHVPQNPAAWIRERFVDTKIIGPSDILSGTQCFAPDWIRYQLGQSLGRLGTDHVDVLYLHNVEVAFAGMDASARESLVRRAFAELAFLHTQGRIRAFGLASWGGFIEEGGSALSLEQLIGWAEREGCRSLFKYVQAPFNVSMPGALLRATQTLGNRRMSLARALATAGMELVSSAPLLHGRLAEIDIPDAWASTFPGFTAAQVCLAMACSAPSIASTVVGVKSADHLAQMRAVLASPSLSTDVFLRLVRS
jgi:aryl-alcohol dehydrogenase-like predicted oxidoreductase